MGNSNSVTRQTAHQDTKHVKDKVDVTATITITIAAIVVLPQIKGTVNAMQKPIWQHLFLTSLTVALLIVELDINPLCSAVPSMV